MVHTSSDCPGLLQAVPQWPELQEAVARLCQAWWAAEAPGREALVAQTLPYLLLRALTSGARCLQLWPLLAYAPHACTEGSRCLPLPCAGLNPMRQVKPFGLQ